MNSEVSYILKTLIIKEKLGVVVTTSSLRAGEEVKSFLTEKPGLLLGTYV